MRYLHSCPDFLVMQIKRLHEKIKVNFKNYDVTDWKQIVIIHILLNISFSEDDKAMKFSQLIKYSVAMFSFKHHAENKL